MRFGRWYPLAEAAVQTPADEGVLQVRISKGLVDYPSGKSAMVFYAHAADLRAVAVALAEQHAERALWCRHLDLEGERGVDLAAFHAKLVAEFVRRFGRAPSL